MIHIIDKISDNIPYLITAITTLATIYLREYWIKYKAQQPHTRESYINKSNYFLHLNRICGKIKDDTGAAGVYIGYFHNGEYFKNGISMDKYSVVASDNVMGFDQNYKARQSVSIRTIEYAYNRIIIDGKYYIHNIRECCEDVELYKDITNRKVNSLYYFLISDNITKLPIGFICVEYTIEKGLVNSSLVWKHSVDISNLIFTLKQKH